MGHTATESSPSQPARSASSSGQLLGQLRRRARVFRPRRPHLQHPGRAVGLDVDPADQRVAEQERQHVVAVDPLRRRQVDLDLVAEAEQPLGPGPLPHHRVERREQRPGADPARQPRVGPQPGRVGPALHPHRQQLAGLDQLGRPWPWCRPARAGSSRGGRPSCRHRGPGPRPGPARAGRPRSTGSGSPGSAPAAPARSGRRAARSAAGPRSSPHRRRTGTRARSCRRASSTWSRGGWAGPRRSHRPRSAPPGGPARGSRRESRGAARTSGWPSRSPWPGCAPSASAGSAAGCSGISDAACPQYSNSSALRTPGQPVEQVARVRPEAGEDRQVVRADQHVDRVDLQQPHPVDHPAQVPCVDPAGRPRLGEALGGERDPARLPGGERLRSGHGGGCFQTATTLSPAPPPAAAPGSPRSPPAPPRPG